VVTIWERQAEAAVAAARSRLDGVVAGPVLETLAAAGEPLTMEMLIRLAGADLDADGPLTMEVLVRLAGADGPLVTVTDNGRCELADPAVRALLPDTAHARIADHYLDRWGGLDAGLPRLAADLTEADVDGGYPIRHLVSHLERAGRFDDVHRLMTCPAVSEFGPVNLWFEVQLRAGSAELYLRSLERARDRAADRTDADVAAGRPAPSLGREFRYSLMVASAEPWFRPLAPALWHGLLATGGWDASYALAHARRLGKPEERCEALLVVLAHVPPEDRPAVVAEALAAARDSPDELPPDHVVRALAPHLPEPLLEELLIAAALGPDAGYGSGKVLEALAPHLPTTLLGRALEAAAVVGGDALIPLLPYLPVDLIGEAEAIAAGVEDPSDRADALAALLPHLPPERRPHAGELAVVAARSVSEAARRVAELAALLPVLPADQRRAVLAEALEGARALPGEDDRGRALAGLVPHAPALLAEALAALRAAPVTEFRTRLLLELLDHLDGGPAAALLSEILDDINFHSPIHRDLVPPALLARVLAERGELSDSVNAALLPHGLATHLSSAERTALLDRCLDDVLADVAYESAFSVQLGSWLPHLSEAMVERTLAAVRATYDEGSGAYRRLVVDLAPYLSGQARRDLLPLVLAGGPRCGPTMTLMIDLVPAGERDAFVAEAIATAREHGHHGALAALAPHVPPDRRRAMYAEAWRPHREHPVLAALDPGAPFVVVDRDVEDADVKTVRLLKRAYRQWLAGRPVAEVVSTVRKLPTGPDWRQDAWRAGLVTITAVAAAYRELGGPAAVREYADAVRDCYRWWP
jgi:hypothetical protein